jgi:hypothetical protein
MVFIFRLRKTRKKKESKNEKKDTQLKKRKKLGKMLEIEVGVHGDKKDFPDNFLRNGPQCQ